MTSNSLQMPEPEADGQWIRTLNNMGLMATSVDHYMHKFVQFAGSISAPVLDIGAAYGIATIAALEAGAQKVIANDIDSRHLEILQERTPQHLRDRMVLLHGEFPYNLKVEENSLGAVLLARVLHFFEPEKLEHSVALLFRWLKQGGKVFITVETPYLGNWTKFTPLYEQRKKEGHPWPGFVEDVKQYEDGVFASILPPKMHMLDPDVLRRLLESVGFVVEEVGTFARPEFAKALQLDGRESCGAIAVKP